LVAGEIDDGIRLVFGHAICQKGVA
jgi:hypothetical protein